MWSNLMVYSVLLVLLNIKMCHPSGRLSIQLMNYINKESRTKNGDCCDNLFACFDDCDNYFKICVTEDSQSKCNLGKIETKVLGGDKFNFPGISGDLGGGNKNPLVFQFQKWKVVTLSIEVWDEDKLSLGVLVDTIELDIQDNPDPDSQSATTHRKRLASSTSPIKRYLNIDVKVYCDTNFLVPDCSRQCVLRDDDQGHNTCDYVNGLVVCNKFWFGDRCTKYCRPRNDTLGNYACDVSGEKNCSANWFGANCSRYCRKRDDENGHYKCEINTGEKICLSKWYGEDCLTLCSARDNMEDHYYCNSTSGEKICLENWFGANCTKHCVDEKNLSLAHFKCDVNGNRVCFPRWQGQNCSKRIPATIITSSLKTFATFHSNQHRSNTIYTRAVTSSSKNNLIKTPSLNSIVSSMWDTYNQLYTSSFSNGLSVYRGLKINSTSLSQIFPTKSYASLSSFQQATPLTAFNKRPAQTTAISSITSSSSVFVAKNHKSRTDGRASGIKELTTVHMDGTARISTSIATVTSRQEKETTSYGSTIDIVPSSNIQMASWKESRLFYVLSSSPSIQQELGLHSCKHSPFTTVVSSSITIKSRVANTKQSFSSKVVSSSTTIESKVTNTTVISSSITIKSKVAKTKQSLSLNVVSRSSTTIELETATSKYLPSFNVLTTENGTIHATKSSSSSGKTTMHGMFSGVYLTPTQPLLLTSIALSRLSIKPYNQSSIAQGKPKLSKIPTTVLLQTPKPMTVSVSTHRSRASLSTELSSPPTTTNNSGLSTSTGINPVESIPRNSTIVLKNSSTNRHERIAKNKTVILVSAAGIPTFIILICFVVCVSKFHKRKMCSKNIPPILQLRYNQNSLVVTEF